MCQPLLRRMKENDRVVEWEKGLPSNEDLTPLTQTLITPILASAFIIKQQPTRTQADVNELSHSTLAALQRRSISVPSLDAYPSYEKHASGVGGPGFGYNNSDNINNGRGGRGGGGDNDAAGSAAERSGPGGAPGSALGRDGRPGGAFQPPYQSVHREVPYVSTAMQLGVSSSSYMEAQAQGQGQDSRKDSPGRAHSAGGQSQGARDADTRSEQQVQQHPSSSMPLVGNNLPFSSYDRRPDASSYGGGADSSKAGSGGSAPKKARKMSDADSEDGDSGGGPENSNEEPNARTLKRPRLVWTPQLHKRFVDAVGHLGIKNAVPKTIMQLMNVEGLTRENVASHLQKYRLYLKRMQGLPTDGPGSNDQLFASTPLPPNLGGSPLFMANHRDEVVPPAYPPGVALPHMGLGLSMGHYGGYEHHPYGGFARVPTQRSPTVDHSHSHHSHHSHYGLSHGHSHHASQNQAQSSHHSHHQSHSHSHRDHREFVVDSHSQPSSPPRRILTLFPTSSN